MPSIDGTGTKVPRPDGGFNLEAMDAHGGWVASTIDYLVVRQGVAGAAVAGDANWWHTGGLPGTTTLVVRNYGGVACAAFFNSQASNVDAFVNDLDPGMWTALPASRAGCHTTSSGPSPHVRPVRAAAPRGREFVGCD